MEKVSIIGSGNVGANTAFFIAEKGITNVSLYDIQDGLSTGKALDMMEGAPLRKYRNCIMGIGDIKEIADSESVIVAAGSSIGSSDVDSVFRANWTIVKDIIAKVLELASESIIIVATEPVDLIVAMIARTFKIPRTKLFGLGGILDAARLKTAIARECAISADDISALVIGRHSQEALLLPEYTRISGIPLPQLMTGDQIEKLKDEVIGAAALLTELAEGPGTYYTPSAAAAAVVDAIHMDLKRILSLSVEMKGEYGIEGVALSLPCIVGKKGVEKVLAPQLDERCLKELATSAAAMQKMLSAMPDELPA